MTSFVDIALTAEQIIRLVNLAGGGEILEFGGMIPLDITGVYVDNSTNRVFIRVLTNQGRRLEGSQAVWRFPTNLLSDQ